MSGFLRKISVVLLVIAACFVGGRLYAGSTPAATCTLDDAGASFNSTPASFAFGSVTQLSSLPHKAGYVYTGHYTGQKCTGTKIIDYSGRVLQSLNSSTTVYACWRAYYPPSVVLDQAGGSGTQALETPTAWCTGSYLIYVNENSEYAYRSANNDWFILNHIARSSDWNWVYPCGTNGTVVTRLYRTPTRSGYTFDGFYTGQNGAGVQIIDANGNFVAGSSTIANALNSSEPTTIYANWIRQQSAEWVTVSINDQGATTASQYRELYILKNNENNPSCYGYRAARDCSGPRIASFTIPRKTGYTYGGHYTSTGGNGSQWADSSGTIVNSASNDTTVYANWTPNIYTITLNNNSGSGTAPTTVYLKYGMGWYSNQAATTPITRLTRVPTRSNYSFDGFYTTNSASGGKRIIDANGNFLTNLTALTAFTGNSTAYARWTANGTGTYYAITLNANGGTVSGGATDGGRASAGTIYELAGRGWYATNATTYPITASIFNPRSTSGGGAGLTEPTYTNRVFDGYWVNSNTGTCAGTWGDQVIDSNGNILVSNSYFSAPSTLCARWKEAYHVIFDDNAGTGNQNSSVYVNSQPQEAWFCPGDGWYKDVCTTRYEDMTVLPKRYMYNFDGFFTTTTGGSQVYSLVSGFNVNANIHSDTTVYAHWSPVTQKITLDENGATVHASPSPIFYQPDVGWTGTDGATTRLRTLTTIPQKTGHEFGGFYANINGSEVRIISSSGDLVNASSDIIQWLYLTEHPTIVAHWSAIKFRVQYSSGEGSGSGPTSPEGCNYGETCNAPANTYNAPSGKHFTGWACTASSGSCAQSVYSAGASISTATAIADATITLTAQWASELYKIALDASPAVANPNRIFYDTSVGWKAEPSDVTAITSITPPQNSGYLFGGYFTEANGAGIKVINADGTFVTMTDNILQWLSGQGTLRAKWSTLSTVTFSCQNQAGDGSGTPSPTTVQVADGETLSFPSLANCSWGNAGESPYLWGYVVGNSFTDTHEAGDTITWDSSLGDRTYNVWYAPNYFNYEYSCGAGSGTAPASGNTYYHNGGWTIAANTCTPPQHKHFAGWLEPVSGVTYAENTTPTGGGWIWPYNVTAAAGGAFVAQYADDTYTATFTCEKNAYSPYVFSGTAPDDITGISYHQTITLPSPSVCTNNYPDPGWIVSPAPEWNYSCRDANGNSLGGGSALGATEWPAYGNCTFRPAVVRSLYNLTYDCNGGTGTPPASEHIDCSNRDSLRPATNTCGAPVGHSFAGWRVGTTNTILQPNQYGGSNALWPYAQHITLYAEWTPNTYNLTWSCGDGTGTPSGASFPSSITYGSTLTFPASTACTAPRGHTFTGWVVDISATMYQPGANLTWPFTSGSLISAHYEPNEYNITYSCGTGATGSAPASQTVNYGDRVTLRTLGSCAKAGHSADGWNVSNTNPVDTFGIGGEVIWGYLENKTLTPNWSANTYTITYELNGGTQATSGVPTSYTYGVGATINGVPTAQIGSIFAGWCETSSLTNCSMTKTISSTATGNKTFYAKWDCEDGYWPAPSAWDPEITNMYYLFHLISPRSSVQLTRPGQCIPKTHYIYCDANGGVACLEQFTINSKRYHLAELYNTDYVSWGEFGGFADYANPGAYPVDQDENRSPVALDLCHLLYPDYDSIGYNGCVNYTLTDYLNALSTQTGTPWGRAHYTFDGYWTSDNRQYLAANTPLSNLISSGGNANELLSTFFTSDATVYAHWIPDVYKITLNNNGGTGGYSEVYEKYEANPGFSRTNFGDTITSVDKPTKTGHTFAGYYDLQTGGNVKIPASGVLPASNTFGAATTLYAHWTPNTYTVTYDCGTGATGTAPAATTATYNANFTPAPVGGCTNPGRSFAGWLVVGFNLYDSTAATDNKYYNNSLVYTNGNNTKLSDYMPVVAGQTYTWKSSMTQSGGNIRINWFDKNKNILSQNKQASRSEITLTAPANAAYARFSYPTAYYGPEHVFARASSVPAMTAYESSDNRDANIAFQWQYVGGDKTFIAQWTDNTYTITFHPGDGVTTTGTTEVQEWYSHAYRVQTGGSMSWQAITEITLPTKTGYTFAGYYDNASFTGNPVMTNATLPATTPTATYFTADADLYAKWAKTGYTVTYKNGGGTGDDVVQDVTYDTQFTTKPGSIFTKTNYVVTKWNTTSGGTYPNLNSGYTYSTAGNTVLTANWGACTCTKGTHVALCDVTGVANNTCQYSYTCEAGYNNAGATSGTFNGAANTAANTSPNCGGANSYTITVTAGNGISKVAASGWTNSGTATMTKTFDFDEQIDLSTVVTATQKSGYTGAAYTVTNGAGSISGNVYTVGAGNGTITVSATGITTPAGVTITGGTTKVYNYSATTLTGATTTTYDSGITVKYSFGYAPSSNGTYSNWTTASTTKTTSIAKDAFLGTRYYKVRVTASDGTLTSTTTATTPTTMTLDQKKITFNATTNGGTLSGDSPLYVRYDSANVYTGATTTTTGTVPTASKTGYTFNGWYTAQTGGSQIYNASGTLTSATLSGWTGSSKWRATEDKTLYAQFSANTNTPYKVYHYTKNLTGTGYTLHGAVDNLTGTSNASVTLESLARTIAGFTYDAGFEGTATHGTTKPASGAVTTTTILPDGTRVIDLYYNRNSYTITYKNGGGTGSDVTQSGISYMGSFTTKPGTTFTKTNSIMTGWNTTSGGNYPLLDHTYSEYDTTGDTVLTAAWATCGCTPGTGVATCTTSATATNTCAATVTCASGYDQSTATWSCSGASCSSSCSADDYEITLDNANATTNGTAKIYTTYDVNVYLDADRGIVMTTSANPITTPKRVYTVTYNGNNGTVGTTTAANTTATYTFNGYYSAATNGTRYIVGSTGRITSDGISTGKGYSANATWYAQWTSASVTLPNATRAGYTFAGWYDNATDGNLIGAAGATYTPTANKTLYAHWNECTAGNYCDGTGTVTSCSTATNGKYPHSAAGSTSINDCYLTTTAGKYVATAGAGEVQCVANDYCAGGVSVYYGGTHSTTHPTKGGNASCSSGTNNKYNYSAAGTSTVNNCYLTLTTGKYVATAGAGMTNCAANNYSDDTTTKVYYGGTASSTHPTTSSCAACSTLGGGLYTRSAGGTGSTGCYVTTTAGKYIIENTDTAQTTCPAKKYCESATIYWPNVGQIADCPEPNASTMRTTYPANYYNVLNASISWGSKTGATSISQCRAIYFVTNERGKFYHTQIEYNPVSGKYDSGNGVQKYYIVYNPGYYGTEKLYSNSSCSSASTTTRMYYQDAQPCPAGSYCPGLTSMPLCSSGTYAETIGLYSCPTNYLDSAAMSTSINACYLTTTAGKYVATAGAGEVQCTANNYCTGGVVVHYDETGGITACSTGAGSNYATSAAGSDSNTDCYKTVTLDKNGGSGTIQGTSGTNPASVVCHYNTECNFGSASGLTQTGYTFSGGWGTTSACSGTTVKFTVPNDTGTYYACKSGVSKTCNPGYYLKADNATCTACPAGKYCAGGTFTFNGTDQGITGNIAAGYYANGCAKTSEGAVCSTSYSGGMVSGGYYSTGGGTSATPTAAGNGCLSGNTCGKLSAAYYGNGGSTSNGATCISGQVCGTCDINYRANTTTGKTVVTQCETQCAAGKQVAAANAACSTPNGSWYTSQHNVAYGSKSSDTSGVVKSCTTNYATANTTAQTDHDAQNDCKRTITLNKNGGTGTVDASVVCSEGVVCDLPDASGLTQTGYTFAGTWSTTSGVGATGCVSTVTTPTSGTYYACKSADCNEITVDNTTRGGTTANTKLYKKSGDTKWYSDSSCQTAKTTTPRPTKTNATFSGYYTSATNTTTRVGTNANPSVLSTTWTVTGPTTIYAHYNCNTGWQEDGTDIAGTCIGTITATASDKVLTYNGTNGNNGTAQSCANVTVTTPASGASVTYATKTGAACGTYGNAPTLTNVNDGPKTICYKVTATNYETVTGEYTCSMNKANGNVVLSATSGSTVYPNNKTFTVTTNKSGGALSATPTSGNVVATASVSGTTVTATPQKTGTQTITVTSAETVNYNAATATYDLTVTDGGITHDVSDVSKVYDGTALVCNGVTNVVPSGAVVKYRTATSGAYNLTSAPSITNVADSKTIYYQITADSYATVTGQFNCTVTKADCPITVKEGNTTLTSSSVVTLTYPTSKTLTATSSCENAVTLSSGNTSYITVSDKTLNPVKVTSSDITMTASVAESANYNGATASFKAKVNRGTCSITLNPTSGSGTCASNTATFTIDKGSCNGTVTASSSDEDIATVALNSAKTQGTVTRVSAGSATITVNVAQTDQYNATSAEYTFSGNKVAGSTTIKDGDTTVSSGTVAYPNTKTLTATCAGGATPTISNAGTTSVATASISNGTITMTPLKQGTSTITVSCPATDCYNASTATYKLTVNRGTCSITLNPTSGTITYPTGNTATFAINKGSCNGTITASSSDEDIATVALNSAKTQGTVSYVAPGAATITVSSAQTDQYNAESATYEVTNQLETYTITFKTGNKTMGTQSCTYGQNVTLNDVAGMSNIPVATSKGWGFDGWANNVNTTNTDYANKGNMTCGGNVTLYGVWKRDVKFTYFETAASTTNKTSTKQQYYRNTTTSAAGVSDVTTYPLYAQSNYAWSPLGWATTTGATSASISQTDATTTTVTPGATTGTSAGVAYYAVYSRTPQIAYNGNGNTGGSTANTNCEPQTFNAGATNGSTPTCTLANNGFTRTGYTFNKWAAGSAAGIQYSQGDSYTFANKTWTSAKTYTMYANWSANTITLNFASEHGTAPASTTCSYGSTFNMPAAITGVVGYTFHRWNVNSNDFGANETGVACDNATLGVTSGSVTINATWKNNHYRILLDDNGGNGGQVAENSTWGMYERYGQCYIAAQVLNNVDLEASTCLEYIYTAPTKQGYTFTGYYTENGEQVIAADKRVVGSPTLFEQNDTIYAHWTANSDIQYKVYHYTKNLGTNTYSLNGAVDTLYGVADSTVTLADLARTITGFTYDSGFDGTATHGTTKPASGAVLTTTILPNGTRVIDLYYNRDTHTVTLSKGTGIASVTGAGTYEYGASVSINATMNNGYDWYRWTNTNTGAAVTTTKAYTFTMGTADIAYTANAKVHSYTITYDLNQGTSSTTPVHGTNHPGTYKVTDATFTISNPTMTGYAFAGWAVTTAPEGWGSGSSTSGSTNFKVGRGTYGNIAFRATWTANTYSIAYTLNGGAYGANHPASATFDAMFTVNNPTHEHATFTGWNISGMDTTTHTYGTQTTNVTTLSGVTATTFKNLLATAGTVTFTATWNCDTGYAGTNCDAIGYNMQYVCSDGTESSNWTFDGSAPVATNPVHYGQSVQLAGDIYAELDGCRKVWGSPNDANYCDNCFTFGGWTIDAEGTALGQTRTRDANSTVNPWGRTNTTDWCIISDTGNCEGFADDIFYVRPNYIPKQYNIEYMYATGPVSGASANMPASYTYTTETTISNADQTAPAHATFNGWCTDLNDASTCVAAGQPITIGNRDHGDMRYYANWSCDTGYTLTYDANNQPVCSASSITCDPTQYLPANSITCADCVAGNYCPGGTFTFDEDDDQGINICPAGSFCPAVVANHTLCAIGSYTDTIGKTACIACQDGTTTSATGQTSCNADCANAAGAWAWDVATWNANNTVSDLCVINTCFTNYYPIVNNSGNSCELCSSFADGLYPYSNTRRATVAKVSSEYDGDGRRACFLRRMEINGYHIANAFDLTKTACPAGTYSYYTNESQVTAFGESYSCTSCPTNTYSTGGASQCTACLANYITQGTGTASESGCKIYCTGGYYLQTAYDTTCSAVGVGHWAAASWTIQGHAGTYNNCPNNTTTIGYGVGADEDADCGRVLHIGNDTLYLRGNRKTNRTLNFKIGNKIYYANMSTENITMSQSTDRALKIKVGNEVFSVYDDTGETYQEGESESISLSPSTGTSTFTPASFPAANGLLWSATFANDGVVLEGTGACDTTIVASQTIADEDFTPSGTGAQCYCKITSPVVSTRWVAAANNAQCGTKCSYYCVNNVRGTSSSNVAFKQNLYSVSNITY